MRNDLEMKGTNDYKKNYDSIIKDPKPFKAEDGLYYASMDEVNKVNRSYFKGKEKF